MRRSCSRCGRIHELNEPCPLAKKRKYTPKPKTEQSSFRNTATWQTLRKNIAERDHHLCRVCFLDHGTLTTYGLEVHHITPIADAPYRAYDESNLITLCRNHHELAEAGIITKEHLYRLLRRSYDDVLYMKPEDFEKIRRKT